MTLKNFAAAAAVALPTLAGAALLDGANSQAKADCSGITESGKRISSKFSPGGAAKACGVTIARAGFRAGENATGKMECHGTRCDDKKASYVYDFSKNVVTMTVDGAKESFSAAQYTGTIKGGKPSGKAPIVDKKCDGIFSGLKLGCNN